MTTKLINVRTGARYIEAPNLSINVGGTAFAYRDLGPRSSVPLILLNHWGAVLDNFDPRIVDGLTSKHRVIAANYRGIGASGGTAPVTIDEMARDTIALIHALGFKKVDLLGFSLGGFVAQDITLKSPGLVRKLILTGTGPAGGKGIKQVGAVSWPLMIKGLLTLRDPKFYLFFTSTANGRRAAKAFLNRLKERKAGDEVYARPRDHRIGTFAEFIAVNDADVALKPKNLSMEEAASIPLVGLTAWQALVEVGKVKPGQKVFIQAGSGGVGTFAIQLAKHFGVTVATTTSTKNVELVKGLGADVVIDYKTEDFEKVLSGYDLVLHSQDTKALEKSLRVLKPGGLLISISGPPDPEFAKKLGLNLFLKLLVRLLSRGARKKAKSLGVRFSFLFMRAQGQQLSEITSLIESGVIRPVVDKVFPFNKTGDALAYVETGRAKGKVVITVR